MSRAPGIYVHVPFCARVCPYCDFAVRTGGPLRRRAYVESLIREIKAWSRRIEGEGRVAAGDPAAGSDNSPEDGCVWPSLAPFDTIYFGGGTPSSLSWDVLRQIVASLRRYLPIDPDCEITLEVNPEDVTAASLDAWAAVGIDNLSLGIQSFDAAGLELLGRSHTRELAVAALEAALTGSFSTVSLDLIFALPDQSPGRWQADLETALGFGPDHISCYELTIHEGTRFDRMREKGDMLELGEDDRAELFLLTHRVLAENGYRAYEVSSFARDTAHRSSHNQKYWDHSAYLGLGPSAHSFNGIATRWWNERRLVSWEAASAPPRLPVAGREDLSPAELVLESLALGLRTTAGVNLGDLGSRHGIDLLEANRELIVRLERDGFVELEPSGHALAPTLRGLAVADALARSFEIPS